MKRGSPVVDDRGMMDLEESSTGRTTRSVGTSRGVI